ncbi:hypothetical protein C2E23DRAFT_856161 [Lenzites betulinus]|nr:hypothetical protein C2E23DRAFT_856161 [Lenzites betulinus]
MAHTPEVTIRGTNPPTYRLGDAPKDDAKASGEKREDGVERRELRKNEKLATKQAEAFEELKRQQEEYRQTYGLQTPVISSSEPSPSQNRSENFEEQKGDEAKQPSTGGAEADAPLYPWNAMTALAAKHAYGSEREAANPRRLKGPTQGECEETQEEIPSPFLERTRKRARVTSPIGEQIRTYLVDAAIVSIRGGAEETTAPEQAAAQNERSERGQGGENENTPKPGRCAEGEQPNPQPLPPPPPPYVPMQVDEEDLEGGGARGNPPETRSVQEAVATVIKQMASLAAELNDHDVGSMEEEAAFMPRLEDVSFLVELAANVKLAYEGRMAKIWAKQQEAFARMAYPPRTTTAAQPGGRGGTRARVEGRTERGGDQQVTKGKARETDETVAKSKKTAGAEMTLLEHVGRNDRRRNGGPSQPLQGRGAGRQDGRSRSGRILASEYGRVNEVVEETSAWQTPATKPKPALTSNPLLIQDIFMDDHPMDTATTTRAAGNTSGTSEALFQWARETFATPNEWMELADGSFGGEAGEEMRIEAEGRDFSLYEETDQERMCDEEEEEAQELEGRLNEAKARWGAMETPSKGFPEVHLQYPADRLRGTSAEERDAWEKTPNEEKCIVEVFGKSGATTAEALVITRHIGTVVEAITGVKLEEYAIDAPAAKPRDAMPWDAPSAWPLYGLKRQATQESRPTCWP